MRSSLVDLNALLFGFFQNYVFQYKINERRATHTHKRGKKVVLFHMSRIQFNMKTELSFTFAKNERVNEKKN